MNWITQFRSLGKWRRLLSPKYRDTYTLDVAKVGDLNVAATPQTATLEDSVGWSPAEATE